MTIFEAAMTAEGACGYETTDRDLFLTAWQTLIDLGVCWTLQGRFGRTAMDLIASGDCTPPAGFLYDEASGRLVRAH